MVPSAFIVAAPEHLRDHLVVRVHPRHLDRELAAGTPAETSPALALRARRLTNLSRRRRLALSLRRLVHQADGARAPSHMRAVPLSERVSESRKELQTLADRLAEPGPVRPQGVAQVQLLLTDGTGPLYNRHSDADVCAGAERAIANLSPEP